MCSSICSKAFQAFTLSMIMFGGILLGSVAISNVAHAAQTASEQGPRNAPDWTLTTQSGEEVSFSDYKGKPVMLHFWGTWCPYCKKLHPGLERVRAQFEPQGLVVLGISVNEPIGVNPEAELKARGINFKTLVEGDDVAIEDFEISGTPTTVFISAQGKIVGSTMASDPDDPRFIQVAQYLVNTQIKEG